MRHPLIIIVAVRLLFDLSIASAGRVTGGHRVPCVFKATIDIAKTTAYRRPFNPLREAKPHVLQLFQPPLLHRCGCGLADPSRYYLDGQSLPNTHTHRQMNASLEG